MPSRVAYGVWWAYGWSACGGPVGDVARRERIATRAAARMAGCRKGNDVMPAGSSRKRERQYEHIKESAEQRGASEERAKELAARTVNKERARSGEAKTASRTSLRDPKSASQRGGERSHRGAQGPTKDQLYEEAKKKHVEGRSTMNKQELREALGR